VTVSFSRRSLLRGVRQLLSYPLDKKFGHDGHYKGLQNSYRLVRSLSFCWLNCHDKFIVGISKAAGLPRRRSRFRDLFNPLLIFLLPSFLTRWKPFVWTECSSPPWSGFHAKSYVSHTHHHHHHRGRIWVALKNVGSYVDRRQTAGRSRWEAPCGVCGGLLQACHHPASAFSPSVGLIILSEL
jgi:hypothetical protein